MFVFGFENPLNCDDIVIDDDCDTHTADVHVGPLGVLGAVGGRAYRKAVPRRAVKLYENKGSCCVSDFLSLLFKYGPGLSAIVS